MITLEPAIRDYDWGTDGGISRLLGREPAGGPEAELWIGTHPGFPTPTADGRTVADVVAADPAGVLGAETAGRGGTRLPFLLKVLSAGRPLSVQVHPSPEQARAGFADEETRGVPLGAPHRNYVDDQPKPEMMVAVTPMRALAGFRDPAAVRADLHRLLGAPGGGTSAELDALLAGPDPAATLRGALRLLLSGGEPAAGFVTRLVAAARAADADDTTAGVVRLLAEHHPADPGIAVGALLNHVDLAPGQAVFLGAGTPHAYLQGTGVEVMSASDNVLRGGLTSKHVDVEELLRIVDPVVSAPHRVAPEETAAGSRVFRTPVPDFALQRLEGGPGAELAVEQNGPVLLLVLAGSALVTSGPGDAEELRRGGSLLVGAAEGPARLRAGDDGVLAFAATVGRAG
ncbi:mannose-6-phosphate isomerase, class I [Kineococcus aurantiacus]|uniref:mannose-6-phosphate isomerase n=1 Tax=Kineococcus aurantiacus TaxID=37633 RepID=A0A7Y9J1M8_9ACTN|nr:mannose-6-phosphate isomerase [Kineococcus aurantiacus]